MNNLDTDRTRDLKCFVVGAVVEYLLKYDPDKLTDIGGPVHSQFDGYVSDILSKVNQTVEAGKGTHLDGSCSDFRCEITSRALKRFFPTLHRNIFF